MWSRNGRVYEDLTLTSKVERLFQIDPRLKKKTVQSSLEKDVIEVQETTNSNKLQHNNDSQSTKSNK